MALDQLVTALAHRFVGNQLAIDRYRAHEQSLAYGALH